MKKRLIEEEGDLYRENVIAVGDAADARTASSSSSSNSVFVFHPAQNTVQFHMGRIATTSSNTPVRRDYQSPPSSSNRHPLVSPSSMLRPAITYSSMARALYTCDQIRPPLADYVIQSSPSASQLVELQDGSTLPPPHNLLQQIRNELKSSNNNFSHLIQIVLPMLRRIPAYTGMVDEVVDEKGNNLLLLLCDRPIITIGRYGAGMQFNACKSDSPLLDCVAVLLDKGSNVNSSNFDSVTPLLFAIYRNNKPLVDFLLARGADTESVYFKYGNTALLSACIRRNVVIAEALIQAGAQLEARNLDGNTAFLLACKQEHEAMIMYLKSKGANLLAKNMMDQDGAAIIRHDLQLRERVCNLIEEYLITKVSLEESMRQEKELEQQREEERVRLRENAVMSSIVRRLEFVDIQEEEV